MKCNRGMSLIELLVGMTVLGLAMTMMVALIPATATSLSQAELRTRAGALAQSELELLATRDIASLTDGPLPPVVLEDGTELRPTVSAVADGHRAMRVRVTVEWTVREVTRAQFRERVLFPVTR